MGYTKFEKHEKLALKVLQLHTTITRPWTYPFTTSHSRRWTNFGEFEEYPSIPFLGTYQQFRDVSVHPRVNCIMICWRPS